MKAKNSSSRALPLFKIPMSSGKNKNEFLKAIGFLLMAVYYICTLFFSKNASIYLNVLLILSMCVYAKYISDGYMNTQNLTKYILRLWVFALLSQILFTITFQSIRLNILFSYIISFACITVIDKKKYMYIPAILFLLLTGYTVFGGFDGMWIPILLPIMFFVNQKYQNVVVPPIVLVLFSLISRLSFLIIIALLCGFFVLSFIDVEKLPKLFVNKYIFYFGYPILLGVICLISFLTQVI